MLGPEVPASALLTKGTRAHTHAHVRARAPGDPHTPPRGVRREKLTQEAPVRPPEAADAGVLFVAIWFLQTV